MNDSIWVELAMSTYSDVTWLYLPVNKNSTPATALGDLTLIIPVPKVFK